MRDATVETANEFRVYLQGFDDGVACTWRTLADLLRARMPDGVFRCVVSELAGVERSLSDSDRRSDG